MFPSTSKFARRGVGNGNRRAIQPEPTDALPGTEEKVRILEERARRGQSLWHPLDAAIDGSHLAARLASKRCGEIILSVA